MTVDVLLARLAALDVVLTVEGERLLFDAPVGVVTAELRAGIAAHRAELARRLVPGATTAALPIALPRRRCPAHIDPRQWVDWSPLHGRILTTCRLCGGFIGYRPAMAHRAAEPIEAVDVEQVEQVGLFEVSGSYEAI